ncbi:hypothetical protein Bca101_093849 [Brassica carinata]
MKLKRKIPTSAITSRMIRDHMAKAVVDTETVTITRTVEISTWPAGKESTITVVMVPIPAVAEAVMDEVEAVYPNRLTQPNPFVTDVG